MNPKSILITAGVIVLANACVAYLIYVGRADAEFSTVDLLILGIGIVSTIVGSLRTLMLIIWAVEAIGRSRRYSALMGRLARRR